LIGVDVDMKALSLRLQPGSPQMPAEGPAPLLLEVSNTGDEAMRILTGDFIEFRFDSPDGWRERERPGVRHLQGQAPAVSLAPGQSLSLMVYLHDHFLRIVPGPATLRLTVTLWSEEQESFTLTAACSLDILPADVTRLASRISEIANGLRSGAPSAERVELLRSVAALDHPHLILLFLEALRDPALMVFHATARRRAAQLGEKYGRAAILEHLRCCGGRYDGVIFDTWSEMGVRLSAEETTVLAEAANPWIRLFSLETQQGQRNRRGAVESLRSEIGELGARAERQR
jgi:hypothetical protein